MKRLIPTICLISTEMLSLTSCGSKVAIIESLQSNLGGRLLNPIVETEIGYYFNSTLQETLSLRYYDKQTGKTVYLCVKPECRHDGGSYCTATDSNIEAMYTTLYDKKLYIVGIENKNILTLYRANLDGTEFTRIKKVMEIPKGFRADEWFDSVFIIHRGKAIISYNLVNTADESDGLTGLFILDLSSLKCEIVDERKRDEIWDAGIDRIIVAGDYVYYFYDGATVGSKKDSIIRRYHIKLKKKEEIVTLDRNRACITNFAVIGDELWYSIQDYVTTHSHIMIYDMKSCETREFEGELFNTVGENVIKYFGYSDIMYDGTYLYVSENCKFSPHYYGHDNPPIFYIYSLDGKRLAQFSHEYAGAFYSISVIDGIVYFQTEELIDTCSVQYILDGNLVWKTEVLIDDLRSQ